MVALLDTDFTIVYREHSLETHIEGFKKAAELRAQGYRVSLGSRSGNMNKQMKKVRGKPEVVG